MNYFEIYVLLGLMIFFFGVGLIPYFMKDKKKKEDKKG